MKHRNKKSWFVLVAVLLGAIQTVVMAVPGGCEAASELLRLRRGVMKTSTGPCTRLILDIKGERPAKIYLASPESYVIAFQDLQSKLSPEITLTDPASPVSAVKVLVAEKGSQLVVQLRAAGSPINHSFLPPELPNANAYRLLVDISLPPKQKAAEDKAIPKTVAAPAEKPAEPAPAKQEPAEPQYKDVAQTDLSGPLKEAKRLLEKGEFEQAFNEYSRLLEASVLARGEVPVASYGLADSYYSMHQKELARVAHQVTVYYLSALKQEPLMRQAAWAYYRCGLAYQASGDHQKAIEAFQKAIQDYPKHPALPLCWLGLAVSYQKTASHAQAIQALRTTLELPLDQTQKTMAYWLLGSSHFAAGEYAPAIRSLEQCLKDAPDWYRTQPLILRYLGESYFMQKQFEKSRDHLLWYLNLHPEIPQKDLILVKIAESLTMLNDQAYANKLFEQIRSQYPDSEGDVIAQIRGAEFSESKGKLAPEDDLALFRELAQKSLSPQLKKLVRLQLATREHKYGNFSECLQVLDQIQQSDPGKTPNDEVTALRAKAIFDWTKQAFENHDFGKVVELYEGNQKLFAEAGPLDHYLMIAEGYSRMRQPFKALSLYREVVAKKGEAPGDILVKMAECSFQAEDFESAAKLCEQLKGSQFELKRVQILAQIYFHQRQHAKVVQCLSGLSEQDIAAATSPSLSGIYGESLFQLGQCEKAIPWLQKASEQMERAGSHADEIMPFYTAQATCHSRLKKFDKAIAILENALVLTGSDNMKDQLNYDISKYYLQLGETDKAIQKLNQLKDSTQSFWQTAARQQLDYIRVQGK